MAQFMRFTGVDGKVKLINLDMVVDVASNDEGVTCINQIGDDHREIDESLPDVMDRIEAATYRRDIERCER